MQLSSSELQTLEALSNRAHDDVPRSHLEKLSRLDLIEPCSEGICLTGVGKNILIKLK